jgi:hypothetical protein
MKKAKHTKKKEDLKKCKNRVAFSTKFNIDKAVNRGHGLGSTKWYGCFSKLKGIFFIVIFYKLNYKGGV